jgi:hypothetical protein
MLMMPYSTHARDYLARARLRLDEQSPEGLFYAAFELRCGIESRLQQYIEAQRGNATRKKQGWRIVKLAKDLERHFKTGDKLIRLVMRESDSQPFYVLMYTPVTAQFRKMGEKLGNLMHAPVQYHPPDNPWWKETRDGLEAVWVELKKATRGNLMGAPLWNRKTGQVFVVTEPLPGETIDQHKTAVGKIGRHFVAEVRYFDDIPAPVNIT